MENLKIFFEKKKEFQESMTNIYIRIKKENEKGF